MRENHFRGQERLKHKLDELENEFLRLKDELRRTEGAIFADAKTSTNEDKNESRIVTNILQKRAEIVKS